MFLLQLLTLQVVLSVMVVQNSKGEYFLLSNGVARQVDNDTAANHFGLNTSSVSTIDQNIFRQFHRGTPIAPIKNTDFSPDGNHRVALERIDAAQERLIRKVDHIVSGMKNPSFNIWAGKQLLSGVRVVDGNLKITFSWANVTLYPQDFVRLKGIESISLTGLDQRVIVVNDTLAFVLYCVCPESSGCRNGWYQMAYAELRIDQLNQQLILLPERQLVFHSSLDYGFALGRNSKLEIPVEKNWCPFLFNNSVLFIERINPLRVMTIHDGVFSDINSTSSVVVRLVSSSSWLPLDDWEFGEMRGGTNAIYLPDFDVFAAVFHTRPKMHGSNLVTYFIGGYTFTAKPPFHLVSISNMPIVDDWMYNGPWLNKKAAYVPFPTTLWLEGNNDLKIVMGFNDHDGYILTLDLKEFMRSQVSVSTQ